MRLVTYDFQGGWRAGIWIDGWIVDSAAAAEAAHLVGDSKADWVSNRSMIQISPDQQAELVRAAGELSNSNQSHPAVHAVGDVRLGPPIPDPDKIICVGLNYRSHAEEAGLPVPVAPILFAKFRNALTGPTSPIILPDVSDAVDYEAELAMVIGRRCRGVTVEDALSYVAGYMAFNDVTARDLQFRTSQWLSGKTLDTFAPCGPALVINEVSDPHMLGISLRLNGQTLQQGTTGDMIFPVAESLSYISNLMTLEPGDIITTGTPAGVGFNRTPPIFLRAGDLVEVEIEGIGMLRNPVVAPMLPTLPVGGAP